MLTSTNLFLLLNPLCCCCMIKTLFLASITAQCTVDNFLHMASRVYRSPYSNASDTSAKANQYADSHFTQLQ